MAVVRARPRVRPHVARAPQGPAYLRPLNQRQIGRLADKQTAAAMAAARAPIVSAQAATDARARAAQAAIQGFGTAAMKLYTPPSEVQKEYSDAAQEIAGVAKGFTSAAGQDIASKEQANADFLAQQAPGASAQNEPNVAAGQDASYYLGGYVPSASLEAQGAAAAGTAAGEPLLQAARSEQDILGSQAQNTKDDAQYVQDMLDLAAKQPDIRNQILNTLYTREQQKFSDRIQQQAQDLYSQKFGVQTAQENRRLNIEQQNANTSAQRALVAAQQGNLRLSLQRQGLQIRKQSATTSAKNAALAAAKANGIDASASKAAGHLVNHKGEAILDPKTGKPIPVKAVGGTGSGGANTGPGSTAYKEAFRYAHTNFLPKYISPGVPDPTQTRLPFPQMQGYLVHAYGLTRAQARKLLVGLGIKPNGTGKTKKG